jgi:hypothetical protein
MVHGTSEYDPNQSTRVRLVQRHNQLLTVNQGFSVGCCNRTIACSSEAELVKEKSWTGERSRPEQV